MYNYVSVKNTKVFIINASKLSPGKSGTEEVYFNVHIFTLTLLLSFILKGPEPSQVKCPPLLCSPTQGNEGLFFMATVLI
jgi:hypothetical protein